MLLTKLFIVVMFAGLLTSSLARANDAVEEIVYTSTASDRSDIHYYTDLLVLALDKTKPTHGDYTLRFYGVTMNQERQLRTVGRGDADVMWTMTTDEREKIATPVKFPLLKGSMGKRVFIIHKDKQASFNAIHDATYLKRLTAIQAWHWPDTGILRANGFKVEPLQGTIEFEQMLELTRQQKADYFPRGLMEAKFDLQEAGHAELVIEQYHMFDYPAYMYFFTPNNKPKLTERLLKGLMLAHRDGSFDKLFLNHPHHRDARDMLDTSKRRIHRLDNPLLSYRLDEALTL